MGAKLSAPMLNKSEDDYRAEDDHRTLERAEEVRNDPNRMKGVLRHHRRKMVGMARIGKALGKVRKARR